MLPTAAGLAQLPRSACATSTRALGEHLGVVRPFFMAGIVQSVVAFEISEAEPRGRERGVRAGAWRCWRAGALRGAGADRWRSGASSR
jgi:hypothetical protein